MRNELAARQNAIRRRLAREVRYVSAKRLGAAGNIGEHVYYPIRETGHDLYRRGCRHKRISPRLSSLPRLFQDRSAWRGCSARQEPRVS